MVFYQYLDTFEQIQACCANIMHEIPPRIALDIESSSNTQYPELLSLALPMCIEPVENYSSITHVQTHIVVYLLQLSKLETIPPSLIEVLQSRHIVKVGCDLGGDGHTLKTNLGCQLYPTVDIQLLQLSLGSRNYSLDDLGQQYLGTGKLAFSHRNADWSGDLTLKQLEYAVIDAYLTLGVFEAMLSARTSFEHKSESSDHENTVMNFLAYSTIFSGKRAPTRAKAINAVVNNYAPWRKLHPNKSKPLAQKAIDELVEKGVFQISGSNCLVWSHTQYELPPTESAIQLQALYEHIQKVYQSPMKYTSLVRALSNKFWTETPVYAREERTKNAINQMLTQGQLSQNGNAVFW